MATTCDIYLLGGFRVVVDDNAVPRRRLAPPARRRAGQAAGPGAAPSPASRAGHGHALARPAGGVRSGGQASARRCTLRAWRSAGRGPLARDAGMVTLIPDGGVNSDVERFETAAGEALGSGDERSCTTAAEPGGGGAAPRGLYAPGRRSRGSGCARVLPPGPEGRPDVGAGPRGDGADEQAHRPLMQAALDSGDRRAAICAFERLRQTLRTDLGVGPSRPRSRCMSRPGRCRAEPPTAAERTRALLAWGSST